MMKEIKYLSKNEKGFSVEDLIESCFDGEKTNYFFYYGSKEKYKIFQLKKYNGYYFAKINNEYTKGYKSILDIRSYLKQWMIDSGFRIFENQDKYIVNNEEDFDFDLSPHQIEENERKHTDNIQNVLDSIGEFDLNSGFHKNLSFCLDDLDDEILVKIYKKGESDGQAKIKKLNEYGWGKETRTEKEIIDDFTLGVAVEIYATEYLNYYKNDKSIYTDIINSITNEEVDCKVLKEKNFNFSNLQSDIKKIMAYDKPQQILMYWKKKGNNYTFVNSYKIYEKYNNFVPNFGKNYKTLENGYYKTKILDKSINNDDLQKKYGIRMNYYIEGGKLIEKN